MAYFMSVSDPAAYAQAFQISLAKMRMSDNLFSAQSWQMVKTLQHTWYSIMEISRELVMNQPQALDGWSDYASDVRDLRTVEATAVLNVVKRWD